MSTGKGGLYHRNSVRLDVYSDMYDYPCPPLDFNTGTPISTALRLPISEGSKRFSFSFCFNLVPQDRPLYMSVSVMKD
jgi:hypothetical protein